MLTNISLKRFVITIFLITGLLLTFGYSLVCKHFYYKGMESITSVQLEGVGDHYVRTTPFRKRQTLQRFERFFIAPSWDMMPSSIKDIVGNEPPKSRFAIIEVDRQWFGPPKGAIVVWRFERGDQVYYICRQDRMALDSNHGEIGFKDAEPRMGEIGEQENHPPMPPELIAQSIHPSQPRQRFSIKDGGSEGESHLGMGNDNRVSFRPKLHGVNRDDLPQRKREGLARLSSPHQRAGELIDENTRANWNLLIIIGLGTVVVLTLLAYLLYNLVSKPIFAIEKWAISLDADRIKQDAPDFVFPELNEIAKLMKTSLSTVEESLSREHKFLRHASHELRTPIAVIRNNVELFSKIGSCGDYGKQKKLVSRIDRASQNMQDLTETILWLSRDNVTNLSKENFSLEFMVQDLVSDLNYLLGKKNVDLSVKTKNQEVSLPKVPVQIIVANLIRNAFQHSWDGVIFIKQEGYRLSILNPRSCSSVSGSEDLGFGLGLKLTKELTEKLGWEFIDESTDRFYKVIIVFSREES